MPHAILAATDFSAAAYIALERAAQLAHSRSRCMTIVHVYNEFAWANMQRVLVETPPRPPAETAERELRRLADALASRYKVKDVRTELRIGRAAAEIVSAVIAAQPQLLVLRAQGEGLAKGLGLGGTALKVIRAARSPVLVARMQGARPYERAVTGVDFSDCSRRACKAALDLFPKAAQALVHAYWLAFEGRLQLAGADRETIARYRLQQHHDAERKLRTFMEGLAPEGFRKLNARLRRGHAVSALIEDARAHAVDVIALGKHGGSTFNESIFGSVTHGVLHSAECDVLVVP